MRVVRETLTIDTRENQQFIDITNQVREVVCRSGVRNGMLVVNSIHTTLGLFVKEFQSALIDDLGDLLQKLVPCRAGYLHDDPRYSDCERRNAHAHLRSVLLGRSLSLAVAEGEPVLAQFESIIAAELDGPRNRRVSAQVMGE